MGIAFDYIDVAFPIDAARMLPRGIDLLPVDLLIGAGEDEISVAIEHHHRFHTAIEHIDVILRIDGEPRDAGLVLRAAGILSAGAAGTAAAGTTRRGLRLALSRWRRCVLQAELHPRRQLRPVRNQAIPAVPLCSSARRTADNL